MNSQYKKWVSASDIRYIDSLSLSMANQLYSEGFFRRYNKYLGRYLDKDLAESEIIVACANKIKIILISDSWGHEGKNHIFEKIKKLLSSHLVKKITKQGLWKFNRKLSFSERILSFTLSHGVSAFFTLKVISFYLSHLIGLIFINKRKKTIRKSDVCNIVLGGDDLLSGMGSSYAKVLKLFEPHETVIFSPDELIRKKKEYHDNGFDAIDVNKLRTEISPHQYGKIIQNDICLVFSTVRVIWSYHGFSSDIYKFMIRMMTWRLFNEKYTYSKIFKAMVRNSTVDSYFSRSRAAKIYFIYFSITPNPISSRYGKNIYGNLDYCKMNVDYIISDSISNKMFTAVNDKYIHLKLKPFRTSPLLDKIEEKKRKVVFLDNTWGYGGVNSIPAMLLFFELIMELHNMDKYDVRIKLKKNVDYYRSILEVYNSDAVETFNVFTNKINHLVLTDTSSIECIDWADLVISSPLSSVIYEALSSKTKVVVYDPKSECIDNDDFIFHVGDIYFNNKLSLVNAIEHILSYKSFGDYVLQHNISVMKYSEYSDEYETSTKRIENIIKI